MALALSFDITQISAQVYYVCSAKWLIIQIFGWKFKSRKHKSPEQIGLSDLNSDQVTMAGGGIIIMLLMHTYIRATDAD